MDDVTALRDALLEALPSRYFHREDMDNLDVLAALDTLIAAVEARARGAAIADFVEAIRQRDEARAALPRPVASPDPTSNEITGGVASPEEPRVCEDGACGYLCLNCQHPIEAVE